MKIISKKTRQKVVYLDTPSTSFDGDIVAKEVEVLESITVRLNREEFEKVENILALSDKQYRKFLKKFRE